MIKNEKTKGIDREKELLDLEKEAKSHPTILNKHRFAARLALRLDIDKETAMAMVDAFWDEIVSSLEDGYIVQFHGRGKFELKNRKGHVGRNPKTQEEYTIPDHKAFVFSPSRTYKRNLRENNK